MKGMKRRLKTVEKASTDRGNEVARMRERSERLARARERSGLPERPSIWENDPPPQGLNLAELMDLARRKHKEREAEERKQ